jgi:hypothetical protein
MLLLPLSPQRLALHAARVGDCLLLLPLARQQPAQQETYLLLLLAILLHALVMPHHCQHQALFPMLASPVMVNACAWLQALVQVHVGCAAAVAAGVPAAAALQVTAAAALPA